MPRTALRRAATQRLSRTTSRKMFRGQRRSEMCVMSRLTHAGDGTTPFSSAAAESLSSNISLQLSSIILKTSQRPTPTTKASRAKATNSQSGKHSHHPDDLDVAPKGSSISSSASPTQSAGGNSKTSSSDGNCLSPFCIRSPISRPNRREF